MEIVAVAPTTSVAAAAMDVACTLIGATLRAPPPPLRLS